MLRLSRDLLIGEFLDLLRERAEEKYNGKIHQAFVDWYIDAEFGRVDWKFTDDVNDGGIDAVIWLPDEKPSVAILQSKFSESIGRAMLSSSAYSEFNKVAEAFYWKGDNFEEFLANVRSDVRRIYRKAVGKFEEVSDWRIEKKAFRLVTGDT